MDVSEAAVAAGKCGALNRQGKPCGNAAGKGTDHKGEGRCKNHGGAAPIKSGRYSTITRSTIKGLLEQFEADANPLDLTPELHLLRALILDYIERYQEFTAALIAWHEDESTFTDRWGNEQVTRKPPQVIDILSVAKYITAIGQISERIEKAKKEGSVSLETLNRVIEQLGVQLVKAAQETVKDAAQRATLLSRVEDLWQSIQLEQPGPGGGKRPS